MKKIFKYIVPTALLASVMMFEACSPEYVNPATASAETLASSREGLINLCVGIQRRYAFGRQSPVYTTVTASGFVGAELRILNTGNTDEANLATGKSAVDGSNNIVSQLWNQSYLTIKECNIVLDNIAIVGDAPTKSGVQGYAAIFKALSLGNLATFFEKAPKTIGTNQPFVTRNELLTEAITILDAAAKQVESAAVSAEFRGKVPAGIDVQNTLYALQARYYNMLGNNDKAIEYANKVSATVKSGFNYDAVSPNPIFFVSISNVNVYQPRNMVMGMPAVLTPDTPNDKRIAFYLRNAQTDPTKAADPRGNAPFFNANTAQLPIYLNSEMTLIKAEAFARKDMPAEAVAEINKIRRKTAAQDAWGVGAGLTTDFASAVKADILTEVYRQRCIELFMSGLKMEDARRFGRNMPQKDVTDPNDELNRVFFPYPFSERDNNTNTPADPQI